MQIKERRRYAFEEDNTKLTIAESKVKKITQQAAKVTLDLERHEGQNSNLVKFYEDLILKQEVRAGLIQGTTLNS